MSKELFLIGLSHRTAPIAVRERLAVPSGEAEATLRELAKLPSIGEVLVLSTCNRVEVYGAAPDPAEATRGVRQLFEGRAGALGESLYEHSGDAALRHLFRVASSLDSMVVGEPQILGQLKDAVSQAEKTGTVGKRLTRTLNAAFAAAKRVRHETAVGEAPVSMATAAVHLAAKIFGKLAGRTALLLGAGEMGEAAAKHLCADQAKILIVNRTLERAQKLAAEVGGEAKPWDELARLIGEVDIVLCSTAAPRPVITPELIAPAVKARKYRPLFFVDLAVPRDVDPAVNDLPNVYLYDVDDLQKVVEEGLSARAGEAGRAELIVEEELTRFVKARAARDAVPILGELRTRAEALALAEAEKTARHWGAPLTDKQRKSMEGMARAIVNKLLHEPTMRLRAAGERGGEEAQRLAEAAEELFGAASGDGAPPEIRAAEDSAPEPQSAHEEGTPPAGGAEAATAAGARR